MSDPGQPTIDLSHRPRITPWSAARLSTIFRDYAADPSAARLAEARLARQCLSQFWLNAPIDSLEFLYASEIGQCYRTLITTDLSAQSLLRDEETWKDLLCQRLFSGLERPETANLLLAVMPYFRRGKMKVRHCDKNVPSWLLEDYASLFEPELLPRLRQPSITVRKALAPVGHRAERIVDPAAGPALEAALPGLPRLASHTGEQALQLTASEEFLTRLSGLVNLFEIDPTDADILQELASFRRQIGQIWLDTPDEQVKVLFDAPFGEAYRKLLRSGYVAVPLADQDRQLRLDLARYVRNMTRPKALQVVLAVLPFFPPGKIEFAGGEQFMPQWLLGTLPTLYVKA
ncbi:hypothetical protein [Synechococcus sp. CCY 9618]|uniref:hypothetical protein n=1 Tax=Synechococcus sp. CCY 9618 TaxID=2815602 RepID=UPI001C22C2DC|nr:hypothetical protein [Synechococcus sp. CCY 9618]